MQGKLTMQESSYPDPEQLRKFAENPMPFHGIVASDLELIENDERMPDGTLRVGYGNVEYRFHPHYISVETEPGNWENVENVEQYDMNHQEIFDLSIDLQIEEDFICVTGFITNDEGETTQFDAYWILGKILIG
jgi:hypothetical protein